MRAVRSIVSTALEARVQASIKVRQPLPSLSIKQELAPQYLELIKDEVNVKEVIVDMAQDTEIILDTELSEELKLEGDMRELLRAIQEARKEAGLAPKDLAVAHIPDNSENKAIIAKFKPTIVSAASLKDILFDGKKDVTISK